MKSTLTKAAVAAGLLTASLTAYAAGTCCGDIACCIGQLLDCCF